MINILLSNLVFYNKHGLHKEELIVEGKFIINAEISFEEKVKNLNSLDQTIDYTEIYDIIKQHMLIPASLLETLAMEIGNKIIIKFPGIKFIKIDILKENPPIVGMIGSIGVSWFKSIH